VAVTALPLPPRGGVALAASRLDDTVKGVPGSAGAVKLGEVGAKGWNLLKGDLPLPAAVLHRDRLLANSAWMTRFCRANGLEIAPHGKTTMAPQLFALQLQAGAWAITAATVQQLAVCRRFGIPRVLLANQPVGRAAIDACFEALTGEHAVELYCLADSLPGVAMLAAGAERRGTNRALKVLVEIGAAGARTGARTRDEALAVARAVAAAPGLALAGIECFEGVLPDVPAVDRLLDEVRAAAQACAAEGLFAPDRPIVLSAGGSAFFDRVGERFGEADFDGRAVLKVLRSGCYLTHDALGYDTAYERVLSETKLALPPGRLQAALEVWAYVQSRPEPGRTILTMGKRDVSHDAGLPVPLRWFRPGAMAEPEAMPRGHAVLALNDQHCHLGTPGESPLKVGDMVAFGIGHPCTTFDKWGLLMVIDAEHTVVDAVRTFF
jgi:D-serine dehydratase